MLTSQSVSLVMELVLMSHFLNQHITYRIILPMSFPTDNVLGGPPNAITIYMVSMFHGQQTLMPFNGHHVLMTSTGMFPVNRALEPLSTSNLVYSTHLQPLGMWAL